MPEIFSVFPQLIFLTPAAVALVRIVAGLYLIYIGYFLWNERVAVARERVPIIGRMPESLSMPLATIQTLLGLLLVVGAWTQVAALLGAVVALKCIVFAKTYTKILPFERSTSILLFVVLLALVITGAGAFSFDLPL